jgi:hypothetical protein
MTRDDIIRMAKEAYISEYHLALLEQGILRFAHLVAEAEREACAQIAFNAKTYLEAAHNIRERGAP